MWGMLLCYVLQGEGAPASTPGVVKGPLPSPVAELAELAELAGPIDVELLAESEVNSDSKARNEANAAREVGLDCVSVATDNMQSHSTKH